MNGSAVFSGVLAGLVTALLGAAVLATTLYFSEVAAAQSKWFMQGLAIACYAVAGLYAGRKAGTGGLMNGAAAALGFLLAGLLLGLIVLPDLPSLAAFANRAALAIGVGAVAGILGVNV